SYHPALENAGPRDAPYTVAECPGMPTGFADYVVAAPWNDPEAVRALVKQHAGELAAIIAEPVMANSGVILPQPGFLQFLRDLAREHGLLLIFDEVITGFRPGLGGAQADLGVTPD